jgi:heme exporter protein A
MKALEDMGLSEKKNILCGELSVGQQRKLTLARILVSDAKIWFLDEPFNTLDSDGFTLLRDLIEAHKNNQGIVVYASHQNVSISDVKTIQLEKAIP